MKNDLTEFNDEEMTDLSMGRLTIGSMRILQKRMKTVKCTRNFTYFQPNEEDEEIEYGCVLPKFDPSLE